MMVGSSVDISPPANNQANDEQPIAARTRSKTRKTEAAASPDLKDPTTLKLETAASQDFKDPTTLKPEPTKGSSASSCSDLDTKTCVDEPSSSEVTASIDEGNEQTHEREESCARVSEPMDVQPDYVDDVHIYI